MAGFFSTMESWTLEAITLAHLLMFSPKVYMRDERLERMHKKTMKKREKKRTAGNLLRHLLMHHQFLTPLSLSSLCVPVARIFVCLSLPIVWSILFISLCSSGTQYSFYFFSFPFSAFALFRQPAPLTHTQSTAQKHTHVQASSLSEKAKRLSEA